MERTRHRITYSDHWRDEQGYDHLTAAIDGEDAAEIEGADQSSAMLHAAGGAVLSSLEAATGRTPNRALGAGRRHRATGRPSDSRMLETAVVLAAFVAFVGAIHGIAVARATRSRTEQRRHPRYWSR